ncbi:MAG TPA: porin family protein [Chitinophagaceae bacterium]|nr:porin family protein [Chitinophagaceae bacterium]
MKRTLSATVLLILFASLASAQSARFGFTAGATYANMRETAPLYKSNGDYFTGVTFGILLDQPMQKNGSFQLGVNFTQKGTKSMSPYIGSTDGIKNVLNYLEVPMNVVFKFKHMGGKLLAGAGVSANFALSGKSTNSTTLRKTTLSFGNGNGDDLKGMDFGVDGLLGYEFKNGFFITGNYYHGVNTLVIGGQGNDKLFNCYFALRVGYLLKAATKKDKKK